MSSRQQQVRQIAEKYRRHGYAVSVDPAFERMPVELAWLHVDLIAERGAEHVLILIGPEDDRVRFLADVVGGRQAPRPPPHPS